MALIGCERCGRSEPSKIHQKMAPPYTKNCSIFFIVAPGRRWHVKKKRKKNLKKKKGHRRLMTFFLVIALSHPALDHAIVPPKLKTFFLVITLLSYTKKWL